MLWWLLGEEFSLFGKNIYLLQFITFRAALAAVTSFLLSLMIGPPFIRWLVRRKINEMVEKTDSARLAELHKGKGLTPTMGGVILLLAFLGSVFLWGRWDNPYLLMGTAVTAMLGLLGAYDDWIKLTIRERKGMSARGKMLLIFLIAVLAGGWLYDFARTSGQADALRLYFPFLAGTYVELGLWFIPFTVLVLAASSNAVNLTDGLDGLAIGLTVFAALAFGVMAYVIGRFDFAAYLKVPHVREAGELTVFCMALAGAGLGFLWFNCHPAEVFMGDTGSLAIGGAVGFTAVAIRQELLLLVAGGIFVVEALSVILQVASYKMFRKRIFKCAPLHHHFQFLNWPETKVTIRFWIVGAILSIVAMASLKLR